MNDLPEELFLNPVWHALKSTHRHFAICAGEAIRYPADVAPFAALATPGEAALRDLSALLVRGEHVWVWSDHLPAIPELRVETTMRCLQMVLSKTGQPGKPVDGMVPLTCAEAPEMVALTDLAYPGFFRSRTCEMGDYFGIRANGELIAMGGERIVVEGYPEISGVCTHPAHRGQGFAASLIWHLVRRHRRDAEIAWLHTGADNHGAIALYERLGFHTVRTVILNRLTLA